MPEPNTAVQGAQDANIATTPATRDKPTTTQQSEIRGLADFLDIPAEVQAQLKPREVKPMEGDIPASHRAEVETPPEEAPLPPAEIPPPEPEEGEGEEEAEGEGEEAEPEEKPAADSEQPQKIDKRQKRINRLTRQRNELQRKVAVLEANGQGKATEPAGPAIPSASPWLRHITDERQLRGEVAKAESLIDWCDANPEGAGLAEAAIDPDYKRRYDEGDLTREEAAQSTVTKWRREADKIVRGAPMRIEEIRGYTAQKGESDTIARQAWPEMFDKGTEEYQNAQTILQQFPFIKDLPQANYAVGLLIEGAKTLQGRIERAKGKKAAPEHRDISERVFEPRVPLAPHTAEPLSREVKPSSQKKLNEAMSNLVKDVDGGQTSLAAAFAALETARAARPGSRTPVRV